MYPTWTDLELNSGLCGERLELTTWPVAWSVIFLLLYH